MATSTAAPAAAASLWPNAQATEGTSLLVHILVALIIGLPLFWLRHRRAALAALLLIAALPRSSSAIVCTLQGTGGSGGVSWSNANRWTQSGTGGNSVCPE